MWMMTWQASSISPRSCDSIKLKKRGCTMWRMTWRASSARPCGAADLTGAGRRQAGGPGRGRAVQVDPIKPKLKPPGTKRLKHKHDEPLSSFAFKFNLRRYNVAAGAAPAGSGGQVLTLVHFSAQLEPFLTQNTPSTPPNNP
jgi:hypothetical protein